MLFLELFFSFLKVGFCSFGGLSMVPVISQEMLSHGWMTLEEVADILAIAEMTPGPNGLNCATFAGMRSSGIPGALVATLGVMTPSLTLCMAAAAFMTKFRSNRYLGNALYGIRPVCLGMLLMVLVDMSSENFISGALPQLQLLWKPILIAALVLVLLVRFKWSIPKSILVAAVLGVFVGEETELAAERKIFGKDFAYIRTIKNFSNVVGRYLLKQIEE